MKKYTDADALLAAMKSSFEADSSNPIAQYALSFDGKPKQLISKFVRCPKLKVPGVSESAPVWTGIVKLDGEAMPLATVIEQLASLQK